MGLALEARMGLALGGDMNGSCTLDKNGSGGGGLLH